MTQGTFHYPPEIYNLDSPNEIFKTIRDLIPTVDSVVDFGCGNGTWLRVVKDLYKASILGIDNQTYREDFLIAKNEYLEQDLAISSYTYDRYDLALCLEVAEHMDESSCLSLITKLTKCSDRVLFSAAIPGQGGNSHINEQWPDYWMNKFRVHDFYPIDIIRPIVWNNPKIHFYYRQNIVLFCRKSDPLYQQHLAVPQLLSFHSIVHPELFNFHLKRSIAWERELELRSRSFVRRLMDVVTRLVK